MKEIEGNLRLLAELGLLDERQQKTILGRIRVIPFALTLPRR